ncbi:DUF2723 domain-containing protein [bacterium]|nr:DUF2723 domain-containing protein [bacterium]
MQLKDFLRDLFYRSKDDVKAALPVCRSSRKDVWLVALSCSIFFLLLYSYTVAPSLAMCHDTGELTTACVIQGVPHSPGYPLFVAVGWLAQQLPIGSEPAYRLNLMCAWQLALGMGFLGATLCLATRPFPAVIATLLTGMSTAIWRQAVVTEVFAMHLLLLSVLFWLALLWEHSEDVRRREIVLCASFVLGCCLAHQHIIALAAPAFVIYGALAKGRGRCWGFSWLNLPILLLSMALPYALQAYFAHQKPPLNWEDVTTWGRLRDHFLRKSYGTGLLNPASLNYDHRAGQAQVTAYLINVARNYFPFPSFVLLGWSIDRYFRGPRSARMVLFWGIALLYGPVFALMGNQPSEEFYWDMMERFYTSSMLGLGGAVALGIDWVLQSNWSHRRFLFVCLSFLPLQACVLNYSKCSQRGQYHAVDATIAMVHTVPIRSAFVVGGDLPAGVVDYLRYVKGEFSDRLFIYPGMVGGTWYRERLPVGVALAAERGGKDGGGQQGALEGIFVYLGKRGWNLYCNNLSVPIRGFFIRQGMLHRFYPDAKSGPLKAHLVPELKRIFEVLDASPRRGNYKMDWRQNYWIRYCITQWIDAFQDLAHQLSDSEPEVAIRAWSRVAEMEETPGLETYLQRGVLHSRLKQHKEALADFKIALRVLPRSRPALQGLINSYLALGDETKARRYQKQLESLP